MNPLKMALQDSFLIIYDPGTKKGLIHCLILSNKKVEYQTSLIPYGDGPNELYNVTSMFFSENYFYLHDVQLQRLVRFKVMDIVSNHANIPLESFKTMIGSSILTRVIPVNKSNKYFIGELMPASPKRFAFLDITDIDNVSFFGNYPAWSNLKPTTVDISYSVKVTGNLFQSKIGLISSDCTVVAVHPYIPVVELIDIGAQSHSRQLEIIGPITKYPPDFTLTGDGWAIPCKECSYNYESVRVGDASFYALYSGKVYKRDSFTGNCIFRFRFKGTPIEKFTLDREVSDFVINENDGIIYTISPFVDDYPLVYFQFPLKKLIE